MGVTYDTGALIAADRRERRMWARYRALLVRREVPVVPAPVVAQCWRGTSRQALLARMLTGCDIEALDDRLARSVGTTAAYAATLRRAGANRGAANAGAYAHEEHIHVAAVAHSARHAQSRRDARTRRERRRRPNGCAV